MRFSRHVPGCGSAFKPFAPTVEPAAPGTGALQFYLVVLEAGFSPLCSVLFSMEIRQFGRKRRNDWQHRERMQDAEKGDGKSCITPIFDTRIRNPSGPVCTRTAAPHSRGFRYDAQAVECAVALPALHGPEAASAFNGGQSRDCTTQEKNKIKNSVEAESGQICPTYKQKKGCIFMQPFDFIWRPQGDSNPR